MQELCFLMQQENMSSGSVSDRDSVSADTQY